MTWRKILKSPRLEIALLIGGLLLFAVLVFVDALRDIQLIK